MASGTSYNGWPASDDPNAIGIDTKFGAKVGAPPFGSGGYAGGMKAGDVSTVFVYLINRLHNEVEPMMSEGGSLGYGCWGWSYRANVNNPSQLSCHASGTAIDYNAPKHPNGTSTGSNGGGGWSGSQYSKIQAILAEIGVVSWLTSNDPMHFEIQGNASEVASAAKRLGGSTPNPPQPTPPTEPTYDDEDDTMQLAKGKSSPSGAIFAYSPGRFIHVPTGGHLDAGHANGLWDKTKVRVIDNAQLDILRDDCVGNGAGKGDNLGGKGYTGKLPSQIAAGK
jgi:hypothetical protein